MTSERPIEPEILISHSGAIRALALELLGDSHAADDVLQDTFVRAIVAPPPKRESLGGWLRSVAEGIARNQRRSEVRRADREARYAEHHGDRGATNYDSEKRSATLRAVMEAVLALDEPYRATILQRYFEGASPSAIAERERVPLATVASRLQRAHKLLRERIERKLGSKNGGASTALALLVGKSPSLSLAHAPHLALSAGAIAMGTKVTLSAGAAVIAVVIAWALWRADSPSAPIVDAKPAVESALPAKPASAAIDSVAATAPKIETERKSAKVESANTDGDAPPPLATGPFAFDLEVLPLDAFERPVAGAEILAAPPGQPLDRFGESAWDGVLHRTWHGGEPAIDLVVQARREGYGASPMQLVRVYAGAKQRVVVPLVAFANQQSTAASLSFVIQGSFTGSNGTTLEFIGDDSHPSFDVDSNDNGYFVDPFLRIAKSASIASELRSNFNFVFGRALQSSLNTDSLEIISRLANEPTQSPDAKPAVEEPPTASVIGLVLMPDGSGAPSVRVALSSATAGFHVEALTDGAGQFTLGGAPIGPALLSVGSHLASSLDERMNLIAGEQTWKGTLVSHAPLRVKLVGLHGEPLEAWRVEAWTTGSSSEFVASSVSEKSGIAALEMPSLRAFRLIARPNSGAPLGMPLAETSWPSGDELTVTLREDPKVGSLKLELLRADGGRIDSGEVRAWRVDTGVGMTFANGTAEDDETREQFHAAGLMPGDYDLEAGAPGEPWTPLGRFHVSAGVDTDVGELRLEAARRLDVHFADEGTVERATGTFSATRSGSLVRSWQLDVEIPTHLPILRGVHTIDWTRFATRVVGKNDDGSPRREPEEKGTAQRIELDAKDVLELEPVKHH